MIFLHGGGLSSAATHFIEIARLLGGATDVVQCRAPATSEIVTKARLARGLVVDCESIGASAERSYLPSILSWCARSGMNVLLLATTDSVATCELISDATSGIVESVRRLPIATSLSFPRCGSEWSRELAGFSYDRASGDASVLHIRPTADVRVIAEIDRHPTFVSVTSDRGQLFVWSSPRVLDPQRALSAESEFELTADEYVPAVIFARVALGDRCFTNPWPRAGLVIDDPLLKPNYGHIDFRRLLASARTSGYHVTLAFIPWNYWRTTASSAALFAHYRDCFSVCVHGCDHTRHEYGGTDYGLALQRTQLAVDRMQRHAKRTGLPYEPLFVCPQEQCSTEAWRALADSGRLLGMINTGCMPRDLSGPQLTAADLLAPAQDRFFGFPVFKRHYWSDMSPFAMALFLEKPAILVEHHGFFRDSCTGIERFARELYDLKPGIRWTSLERTVTDTHWRRSIGVGRSELRFFANKFRLAHDLTSSHTYRLIKRVASPSAIRGVLVNNQPVDYHVADEWVMFEVTASEPTVFEIEIQIVQSREETCGQFGWTYNVAVAGRRALSEWRDNVLSRNPYASRAGSRVVQKLRSTLSNVR